MNRYIKNFLQKISDQFAIAIAHKLIGLISIGLPIIMLFLSNLALNIVKSHPVLYYILPLIPTISFGLLLINYVDKQEKLKIFIDDKTQRFTIPHINATYDNYQRPRCFDCDALLEFKRGIYIPTASLIHYCLPCNNYFPSYDENGFLIDAQESKRRAVAHFKTLNKLSPS